MREPVVVERMGELGLVSLGAMSPAEIGGFVRQEAERWGPIARAAGITG
jgi:tripartite-type tricarboxylate transporter receptor subunit TctC